MSYDDPKTKYEVYVDKRPLSDAAEAARRAQWTDTSALLVRLIPPTFRARARRWFCGERMTVFLHKRREGQPFKLGINASFEAEIDPLVKDGDSVAVARPSCCKLFGPPRKVRR